jgi:peroxiredoxin
MTIVNEMYRKQVPQTKFKCKNGAVMKMFVEPGKNDKGDDMDPFEVSDVDTMLAYLKG